MPQKLVVICGELADSKSELRMTEFISAASQPERLSEDRRFHPAAAFLSRRISAAGAAEDVELQSVAASIDQTRIAEQTRARPYLVPALVNQRSRWRWGQSFLSTLFPAGLPELGRAIERW